MQWMLGDANVKNPEGELELLAWNTEILEHIKSFILTQGIKVKWNFPFVLVL